MRIRTFQLDDQLSVIALWDACGLIRAWNDPAEDIARKVAVTDDLFLVGVGDGDGDGEIVATAMAGYEGHRGWINYLAVDPRHRRSGFGRALMREAEVRLHARGCPKINLQIRTSNLEAVAFYERLGYVTDDVVSMGKRIEHDDVV
jgi:ribosomal protein S18 acetylase RimI-like enzyme